MSPVAARYLLLPTAGAALGLVLSAFAALPAAAQDAGGPDAGAAPGVVQRVARLDPAAAPVVPGHPSRGASAATAAVPAIPCRLAWTGGGSRLACGGDADGRLFTSPPPLAADDPLLQIAEADADVAMALRSLHRVDGDLFGMDGGEVVVRSVGRDRAVDLLLRPEATRRSSPALPGEARFNIDVVWSDADRGAATIRLRPLADNPRRASAGAVVDYVRGPDGQYRLGPWRLL